MPPSSVDMMDDGPPNGPQGGRWRLQTCCLRASLRTGCTIISIWSMCEALLFIVTSVSVLFHISSKPKCATNSSDSSGGNSSAGGHSSRHADRACHAADEPEIQKATALVVIVLLIMCIYFLVSALMLFGVKKKRHSMLCPWLWWSIGEMVATFNTFTLVERSLTILLKIYCCFVVYSYIEELKEERDNDAEDIVRYVTLRRNGPQSASHPITTAPSHVCFQARMTPDDVAAKIDAANAARLYSQRPPPYSLPQPGFVDSSGTVYGAASDGGPANSAGFAPATGAASSVQGSAAAVVDGAVGGVAVNIAGGDIVEIVALPPVGFDAAATATTQGLSYVSIMPPPSYEEATSSEATVYRPELSMHTAASASATTDRSAASSQGRKDVTSTDAEHQRHDVVVVSSPPRQFSDRGNASDR